jgi:hypothetical protein
LFVPPARLRALTGYWSAKIFIVSMDTLMGGELALE